MKKVSFKIEDTHINIGQDGCQIIFKECKTINDDYDNHLH